MLKALKGTQDTLAEKNTRQALKGLSGLTFSEL